MHFETDIMVPKYAENYFYQMILILSGYISFYDSKTHRYCRVNIKNQKALLKVLILNFEFTLIFEI